MSYIPRSSLSPQGSPAAIPKLVRKKHTFRVFGFIATVMILGSIASLAATYAYKAFFLEARLERVKQELVTKSAYDPSADIATLEAFDAKVDTAHVLLRNHLAPSKMLTALEEMTKQTVQIQTFTYTYDPGFQAFLEIKGGTRELTSVALQRVEYVRNALFTDFVMSDITANSQTEVASGGTYPVMFSLEGSLDTAVLAYTGTPLMLTPETLPMTETSEVPPVLDPTDTVVEDIVIEEMQ